MKRLLRIDCFDSDGKYLESITAERYEQSEAQNYAYIYFHFAIGYKELLPFHIESWSLEDGKLTVTFRGGHYIEITRIYVPEYSLPNNL